MSIRLNTIDLIRWLDDQYDPTGNLSDAAECLERVTTQRDALLEACRAMLTFIERHAPRGLQPEPGSPVAMARAAIKAVEEGK